MAPKYINSEITFPVIIATVVITQSAPIRVSCVGDSITAGCCTSGVPAYPELLQQVLGSGYVVTNYGNSGKTMLKKGICGPPPSGDCSYWTTPTYPAAIASTPDVVTIMLGTNDAKNFNWFGVQEKGDSFEDDYVEMIHNFKALGTKPKVYVMVPPPLYPPDPYDMNSTVINSIFPVMVPQIAQKGGADGIIDVFTALGGATLSQPGITCDGCHPVQKGCNEIAAIMAQKLKLFLESQ